MDMEDRTGRRMVVFRRSPVWVDPTGPYSTQLPQHLRLMCYELLFMDFHERILELWTTD
jgi:hypothetical protein